MKISKQLQFISHNKMPIIPHKKNRRNKNRLFYAWKLERLQEQYKSAAEFDIFPSSSEKRGIQLFKETVIIALNHSNVFDFDFTPIEKDYLSIYNPKNAAEFLHLVYLNKQWTEEYFLDSIRNTLDSYILLNNGLIEFKSTNLS